MQALLTKLCYAFLILDKEKATASNDYFIVGKHSDSMWVNEMNIIIYLAHSYSSMVYTSMYEITF